MLTVACLQRPPDPDGTFAPVGTLQGVVVDSYDQLPIDGAQITINYEGKSKSVTTDATGSFAFTNIPASGNPNSTGGANGTYSVNLDLKGAKGDRKYKTYRTQTVAVQFTELRRADTTTAQTANAVQDSVPVSYLVSNITFTVRQTRAVIRGTVFDEQLKAKGSTTLALVNRSNGVSVPNGATFATATTGADGKFSFTEVEEGAIYQLVLPDQNLIFAGGTNNYTGSNFTALELGVETILQPVVLATRPASDPTVPYVSLTSPSEDAILAPADANKPIVLTFSEPMNAQRGLSMVSGFRRLGPRNRPDDNIQLTILFDKKWNTGGTVFTITPATPLEPGYRYSIDFTNGNMVDVAGNVRTRVIPYTQPAQPDAVAISNGTDDLQFAIGSDGTAIAVTGLAQEPDTADNIAAGTQTRAFVIENDPSATENSFLTAQNAGFYTVNRADSAYITWAAPTQAIRRFRVWTRVGMNSPILITRSNNPWGVSGNTRIEPLAPSQTAYNIPLSDLSSILANEPAGFPQVGLANTIWNNNLSVQLGVSVVNADGQEGEISFITLKDNTGPAFLKGSGMGMTNQYLNANDSVTINYGAGCATALTSRVTCPKVANPTTGYPEVSTFGQRFVLFDLSEPVDAASVIAANVDIVDGTLANNLGVTNPNVSGSNTEADATIASVVPLNVVNGRTNRIGVVFTNFFGLDTGDKLVLKKTGALKDVTGNAAKDGFLISAPMVDDYPPMIKSVSVDPTTDTVTLVFTKWFQTPLPVNPADGNISLSQFGFANWFTNINGQGTAEFLRATKSINSSNEAQVVLQFAEVGFLRGFNSADTQCVLNNGGIGSRVTINGLSNVDFSTPNGRSTQTVNDNGTLAYENVLADATEPNNSPGAYVPTSGVGTRSSFRDTIAPRLSNNLTDSRFNNASNTTTVAPATTGTFTVDVVMTEYSRNETNSMSADSALNPANWNVSMIELGADNWTGNTANDALASNVTVTVTGVALQTNINNNCGRSPRYRLTMSVQNGQAAAVTVGISKIKLGAAVTDLAGNAVGAAGTRATWAYDPARTDRNGAVDPGWRATQ